LTNVRKFRSRMPVTSREASWPAPEFAKTRVHEATQVMRLPPVVPRTAEVLDAAGGAGGGCDVRPGQEEQPLAEQVRYRPCGLVGPLCPGRCWGGDAIWRGVRIWLDHSASLANRQPGNPAAWRTVSLKAAGAGCIRRPFQLTFTN
jgi:hypothetical protein